MKKLTYAFSWMELMSTKVCDYRWLWQSKPGAINHQSFSFWKHYRFWFVFFSVPNFQPLTCDSKVSLFSWRKRRKMNCLILDILVTRGNTKRIIGSLTVSGQRVVKYSIKIVSILRPLDYVFASPTENVKSRLVATCLDDSFQKRDTLKRGLKRSRKRRAKNETRFFSKT